MTVANGVRHGGTIDQARVDHGFMAIITSPRVDRVIAIIAALPFVYATYLRLTEGVMTIPREGAIVTSLLLIATMLVRRPPVRVTPNPWFWLLAFVATYGALVVALLAQRGRPLVSPIVTNVISLVAVGITVWARVSLGRNIGFVPAQRELVTDGAYAYMRHPIYTGIFVAYSGLALRAYSPVNVAMVVALAVLFVIKSFIEEGFLRQDPEYAAYMQRTRYRWFPGIA